jgi:alpha-tubulin suppressor-like RCC1 family protein
MFIAHKSTFTLILSLFFFILCTCGACGGDDAPDPGGEGGGVEAPALTVASTVPSNGSLGVRRDVQIDITFSQPVDGSTITDRSVTLAAAGVSIPVTLSLNDTGDILRLSPVSPLAAGTSYDVAVTAAVRDRQGTALNSDYRFSFITEGLPVLGAWTKVCAGRDNGMLINENGTLWMWGCNVDGQNGNGLQGGNGDINQDPVEKHRCDVHVPTQVGANPDWAYVSSGNHISLGIMKNGMLWSWGAGYLGNGARSSLTPAETRSGSEWAMVESSIETQFSCAIKTDGTLWSWGSNYYGQLGNGQGGDGTSAHNINAPAPVNNETDWLMVAAGGSHAAAIKMDGTLWSWGSNDRGQLGDGTRGDAVNPHGHDANTPRRVGTDADWAFVASKGDFTLAIRNNGTLWAWGSNNAGQLGIGTVVDANSPVQVGGDANWALVAPGKNHVAAIRNDGSLWTWGGNGYGQLGDGGGVSRGSPRQVGTDTGWSSVSSGVHFTLALKKDGTVWAWGLNDYYQLGDGTQSMRNVPVQIR